MATGKIKFFNDKKGFGFIAGDDGRDYFLHFTQVKSEDTPKEGDSFEFETMETSKGLQACNAVILGGQKSAANSPSALSKQQKIRTSANQRTVAPPQQRNAAIKESSVTSPYTFIPRPVAEKSAPTQLHEKLNDDCYDIAFEVIWKALTPVAANPCSDLSQGTSYPPNNDKHFQGYDKRWLMVDNRLAISPFTVKSAIANGFAALLGSCYRVEKKEVEHKSDPDTFQCTGAWRRYRVSRENSFPGVLAGIDHQTGNVSVFPVTEYFYTSPSPPPRIGTFIKNQKYYIESRTESHKEIITRIESTSFQEAIEVLYVDCYRFGMNLSFNPGDFNKNYHHRFCKQNGPPIPGKINTLNLKSCDRQKENVYMGVFKKFKNTAHHDKRTGYDGKPWDQDLTKLTRGNWVYYQLFDGKVAAIGLNYQFKTAFHLHDDAVPSTKQECRNPQECCPRCALFGVTDDRKDSEQDAIGLRGRFKAATLLGPTVKKGETITENFERKVPPDRLLKSWTTDNGKEIARQFLLPILGQSKANKRDIPGGYYDDKTGLIRGAKEYVHASLNMSDLNDLIAGFDGDTDYTHTMRNYAMVCVEGQEFTGTLGVENCSQEEIAALLLLLEHGLAGHGFKIGLGKSLGLGSMASTITRVWVRTKKNLQKEEKRWECIEVTPQSLLLHLEQNIDNIGQVVTTLKTVHNALNLTRGRENRKLKYPQPGNKYWADFKKKAVR